MADLQEQVKDLRKQGKSFTQIAKELGTTRGTVAGILNRAGMVGDNGSDKIEARPASDVPNPTKSPYVEPDPVLAEHAGSPKFPMGTTNGMPPQSVPPAASQLPKYPMGTSPGLSPQPGNSYGMPPQSVGLTPGQAPAMQPMSVGIQPGNSPGMPPQTVSNTPSPGISRPPNMSAPAPAPTPWQPTVGGSGNGITPPPAPTPPAAPSAARQMLGTIYQKATPSVGADLAATGMKGIATNLQQMDALARVRKDPAAAQAAARQTLDDTWLGWLKRKLGGDVTAPDFGPNVPTSSNRSTTGLQMGNDDSAPRSDARVDAYDTGAPPPTIDKYTVTPTDPNAPGNDKLDPNSNSPLMDASIGAYSQQQQAPQNPWGIAATPPNISATSSPGGQGGGGGGGPRVTPPQAPQVSTNPIGGQNPYNLGPQQQQRPLGAGQQTPPPGQNGQQGVNPVSNIVSSIVQLPANVVKGVMHGLAAYQNPSAWTNTPGQVQNMSTNIANGQPPAPSPQGLTAQVMGPANGNGMTPPPGTGQPGSWQDWNPPGQ